MEAEKLISTRLNLINLVEPKSSIEDVLFYNRTEDVALNIALIPIEGLLNGADKEHIRKDLFKKLISKSFLHSCFENPETIAEFALFSIDTISEVDHCFLVNTKTLAYEYLCYDFNGNILINKHFKLDEQIQNINAIDSSLVETEVYYPSILIENFFKEEINKPVLNDSRTISYDILYGYDSKTIRTEILEFGLTDFDAPYHSISADEKVNLYCYFNLKKHYFTTYALLERFLSTFDSVYSIQNLNFIDYGCGPLTSAIALGDIFIEKTNEKLKVKYFGIDSSDAMIRKAKSFSNISCFSPLSTFNFTKELNGFNLLDIAKNSEKESCINVINCSYLFASETLNENELLKHLKKMEKSTSEIYLLYQNSTLDIKNKKWESFKNHFESISLYSAERHIKYSSQRNISFKSNEEKVRYEIIKFISLKYTI